MLRNDGFTTRLVCIHGFDPSGTKVGGIETHVRQILRRHPDDFRILMIGIDDTGTRALGQVHRIEIEGRTIDFVPVLHIPGNAQAGAATQLAQSATLRFAFALLKYLPRLRKLVSGGDAVAEVERYEYAPIARLLGLPLVTIVHNEGDPRKDGMDSILKRYWYVNIAAEWVALRLSSRVFGVTPGIRDRIAVEHPGQGDKTGVLTVSVDTALYAPTPFDVSDGKLRLVYAGRLDEFKNPPMMFRVAGLLHDRLGGAFEFHYCGSANPHRFAEFAAIEPFTVRHGALSGQGVAAVMRTAHIGILVSHFEGMPCFLLELLASGRPFGGLHLPQFEQVVVDGVNGRLVERGGTPAESDAAVADAILGLWTRIRTGDIDPAAVSVPVQPWSVDRQLGRLFDAHRAAVMREPSGRGMTGQAVGP